MDIKKLFKNFRNNSMNQISINGQTIVSTNGNISFTDGELYVDGVKTEYNGSVKIPTPQIKVTILSGTLQNLQTDGSVICEDVHGDVTSGGSINCDNILGNASAGGSINCDGIGGNVSAGGSIKRS